MCTVTVVPHAAGVRLLSNRDERRTRAAAIPPQIHASGGRRAAFPVDPEGGGTWIGVNDAGLVAALLNRQRTPGSVRPAPRSRGLIVRQLLDCTSVASASDMVAAVDPRAFEPFRVVIVRGQDLSVATSDGSAIRRADHQLTRPLLFTSSSLGDDLVERPRRRLFDRLVVGAPDGWLDGQARFHDHQWPSRPEISVRMERTDALTVSRTTVDVTPEGTRLVYEAPVTGAGREVSTTCSCSL